MAAHAKKSASGSKQWMRCPGSLAYCDSLPEDMRRGSNPAAMTGTAAHALGEFLLRTGQREVQDRWIGTRIWLDQNEDAFVDGVYETETADGLDWHEEDAALFDCDTPSHVSAKIGVDCKFLTIVDEKMQSAVQVYLDTVWGDRDEMGSTTEMFVERSFDLTWLRPDMFGTSDCTLYQFMGLLRVIDYKNGFVDVQAENNSQGMYYALGMAHCVDWLFDEVEIVIVQPNSRGEDVKRWRISRKHLEEFRDELAARSDVVDEAFESFGEKPFEEWSKEFLSTAPDGDQCTYCDAFAVCPAAQETARKVCLDDFPDDLDFSDDPPEENPVEVHDEASLERLQNILRWGSFLDKLVKAAKTLGQRRLEQGLEMPGYKLVRGRANRAWPPGMTDDEIAEHIAKEAGVDKSKCFADPKPPGLKSPAQMEKISAKAKKLVSGVYDKKKDEWRVEPFAVKPEGKITMAPETDPRPTVEVSSAADDFAEDPE